MMYGGGSFGKKYAIPGVNDMKADIVGPVPKKKRVYKKKV
jgi:hypothetical protein